MGAIRTGKGQDILLLEPGRHEGRDVGINKPAYLWTERSLSVSPFFCPPQINQTVYIEGVGRVDSDEIRPGLQGNSLKQELGTDENLNVFSQRSFQNFPRQKSKRT